MNISSMYSSFATSQLTSLQSTTSSTSTSNISSSNTTSIGSGYTSARQTQDTLDISAEGRLMAKPEAPDFESMSNEEFTEHLTAVKDQLSAIGVEIPDLSTMSDDEISALKADMAAQGPPNGANSAILDDSSSSAEVSGTDSAEVSGTDRPQGPPPPPPPSGTGETDESSLLETMLEATETEEADDSSLLETLLEATETEDSADAEKTGRPQGPPPPPPAGSAEESELSTIEEMLENLETEEAETIMSSSDFLISHAGQMMQTYY